MEREGFSYRRTTTKKRKNLAASDTFETITKFFLDTRVFQLSVPELSSKQAFNREQVPMALADSYSTTIDSKSRTRTMRPTIRLM